MESNKFLLFFLFLLFLPGCKIFDFSIFQPKANRMFIPEMKLFDISANEIILKAPTRTRIEDGITFSEPIMITTETRKKNGDIVLTTEPVMINFWVKDTAVKPPLTFFDLIYKGLGFGLIYKLGLKSLDVISELGNKSPIKVDPLVLENNSDFVVVDQDGNAEIDRG